MPTIYLARHGVTEWNDARRVQGRIDIGLSAAGSAQAERLAKRFDTVPLSRVYSSPLLRARSTADAVVAQAGCPMVIDDALCEVSLGKWEGLLFGDLDVLFPGQRQEWRGNPHYAPPEGESVVDLRDRLDELWRRLVSDPPPEPVLVVSHGMALSALLGALSGIEPDAPWESYSHRLANCSVSVVEVAPDGASQIVTVNDTAHLA